jgi:hypothetical protein
MLVLVIFANAILLIIGTHITTIVLLQNTVEKLSKILTLRRSLSNLPAAEDLFR